MIDRLKHQTIFLENNITVHYLPDSDAGYGEARIIVPFGHAYNTGDIPQGSFHFLEHMVLNRSKRYPEKDAFEKFIADNGGYINGGTGLNLTSYEISTPTDCFDEAFKGLVSHVFEPIFTEEDLESHKQIVRNERIRSTPFYPGKTELGEYIKKYWLDVEEISLNQRLGSDEDLNNFSIHFIETLHKYYFTKPITVIVGGMINIDEVLNTLRNISMEKQEDELPTSVKPISIVNKEFHEKGFKEVERYEYRFAYLLDEYSYDIHFGVRFLKGYLLNVVGPIYKWLRDEKSWVYDVGTISFSSPNSNKTIFGIKAPLSERYQVDIVREELDKRIIEGLKDNERIGRYFETLIKKEVFINETVSDRIGTLENYYWDYKKTYTGEDWLKVVEKYRQENALLDLYNYTKEKGEFTEFLAKPLDK